MSDETKPPVIRIEGLHKTFRIGFTRKKVEALRGIDLKVESNEVIGFLGPNGAGKTTTIKVMMGIIYPDAGEVSLFGMPLGNVKVKNRIGFLPEQPYFYDYLTGNEFLDFYARFHGLKGAQRTERIRELLPLVGLSQAGDVALRKYSKGMLQRIGMAQALLGDPELVVLDEPMSGLDPVGRRDMREIILRLREAGKTVFFSSHILPDVEELCDRVVIIFQGRVRDSGRLEEILKPEIETVDLQFENLSPETVKELTDLAGSTPGIRVVSRGGLILISTPDWEAADRMEQWGRDHGGRMVGLMPHRETLESYFFRGIENKETGS